MAPSSRQSHDEPSRSRLTPRAPDAPPSGDRADTGRSDDTGSGGGNLVGNREPASPAAAAGRRDGRTRADPVGSALADAKGRGSDARAGAGNDAGSGSHSLGAASGGERASAGRADANRSSRDDGNSREG